MNNQHTTRTDVQGRDKRGVASNLHVGSFFGGQAMTKKEADATFRKEYFALRARIFSEPRAEQRRAADADSDDRVCVGNGNYRRFLVHGSGGD